MQMLGGNNAILRGGSMAGTYKFARRNLLPITKNFAAMTMQGTPNPTLTGTLGGVAAYTLTDDDPVQWEAAVLSLSGSVLGNYTFQVRIGKNPSPTSAAAARIAFSNGVTPFFCGFELNATTGVLLVTSVWSDRLVSRSVTDGGDHWLVEVKMAFISGDTLTNASFFPAYFAADGVSQAASNVGSHVFAAPQLEVGLVRTDWQE